MADAAVVPNSTKARQQEYVLAQDANMKGIQFTDFNADPNVGREPDYYLHVFNIANKGFDIQRGTMGTIHFAACPSNQMYKLVGRFPNIVNQKEIDENGRVRAYGIVGERFVQDLIDSSNLSVEMWREVTDEQLNWVHGGTADYSRRGLFWTRNAEPGKTCLKHGGCGVLTACPVCGEATQEELKLSRARLEKHYKALIQEADRFHREGQYKEIGPEHHLAGEYFRVRAPWHTVAELPTLCENCGEIIPDSNPAFHMGPMGVCVRDWKRAVAAGVKKREDVPDEFRWW